MPDEVQASAYTAMMMGTMWVLSAALRSTMIATRATTIATRATAMVMGTMPNAALRGTMMAARAINEKAYPGSLKSRKGVGMKSTEMVADTADGDNASARAGLVVSPRGSLYFKERIDARMNPAATK